MSVLELNNQKVYNLSSGKSMSEYASEGKKDENYRHRIELIQDLEFKNSSNRVRVSEDQNHILASGMYPPQIRIFETSQLSMKCQRNLNAEVVQAYFLSSDFKKLALLLDDRNIELHAQYGRHFSVRVPRFGRDMSYCSYNCELYIVGATHEIYRLNLEEGRFMATLESQVCSEHTVCDINPEIKCMLACAGEDGLVELWDLRQRSRLSLLKSSEEEITAVKFDGLNIASGDSDGMVKIYDLRFNKPLFEYSHMNSLPIRTLSFNSEFLLSADPKALKVIEKAQGSTLTTIEPGQDINDFELFANSGLILTANEGTRMGVFYVPRLGPAPKWAGYIDTVTEELEEVKAPSLYVNQKFVTYEELEAINGTHLIGTDQLKAYLHGFMMDSKEFFALQAVSEPFSFQEYKKKRVQEKLEEKRKERIVYKSKVKVNKDLAKEIDNGRKKIPKQLLDDSRFQALFNDKEFQIDTETDDFKRLNPHSRPQRNSDSSSDEDTPKKAPKLIESTETQDVPLASMLEENKPTTSKKVVEKKRIIKNKVDISGRRQAIPVNLLLKKK